MNTMAEVLAAHQLAVAWEGEASQGITCLCGLDIPLEKVRGEIDMDFLATHQADELSKAGYGKLAYVWNEGWAHYRKHFEPIDPEFGVNPYGSES